MLTDDDIQRIVTAGAQVFVTKADLAALEREFFGRRDSFGTKLQTRCDAVLALLADATRRSDALLAELQGRS